MIFSFFLSFSRSGCFECIPKALSRFQTRKNGNHFRNCQSASRPGSGKNRPENKKTANSRNLNGFAVETSEPSFRTYIGNDIQLF